ncbi:MAG: hypothetical protein CVU98_01895 [Firmicutes bacterium HGW-Firmicutes-3]|nr:MAG: hypothetical protein CVU98_01895 [Firmicutes bacterium HGW-Firmicutes-3]
MLNNKKPVFWVVIVALIAVVAVSVGLMSNPINTAKLSDTSDIYATSEKWAEALKNRDGKARYEMMAPESKTDYYNSLVFINGEEYPWVIGDSSPYVVSYEIKISGLSAIITYITETSESEVYIYQEQLFFDTQGGKTFISKFDVTVSYLRKDLYEEAIKIQKQVKEGHLDWRLNPESVVLEFVRSDLGLEGGEIISSANNDVVFKKDEGEEIKIKLYRPINNDDGFLAIYEYSIGVNHYILDNNYIAPRMLGDK